MVDALIALLGVCAILGLAWWGLSAIPMPQPLRIVVVVVFAIIGMVVIAQVTGIGGGSWGLHAPR
jgi:hypothetical protein